MLRQFPLCSFSLPSSPVIHLPHPRPEQKRAQGIACHQQSSETLQTILEAEKELAFDRTRTARQWQASGRDSTPHFSRVEKHSQWQPSSPLLRVCSEGEPCTRQTGCR